MRSKRHTRHRLLFDEGLPPPDRCVKLRRLHNVVHIAQLGLKGTLDSAVFQLAKTENRILVTLNGKDFRPHVAPGVPTVVGVSANLTYRQMDLKLCKLLRELTPSKLEGKYFSISGSGIQELPA